jgi:hypothetical protein
MWYLDPLKEQGVYLSSSARVNRADQPLVFDFDEIEPPHPLIHTGRPAADSWHVARRAIARRFRAVTVGDLDLTAIERYILLFETIERAAQRPLVDGRPYLARRAGIEITERVPIPGERVLDPSLVVFDYCGGSSRTRSRRTRSRRCRS